MLSKPNYYIGIQNHALRQFEKKMQPYIKGIDYVNADCLHKASIKGRLNEFIETLKQKSVILVAPKYLGKLGIYNVHIEVPQINCWLERKRIMELCVHNAASKRPSVFIFCSGMPANVWIHRLWEDFGDKHTFLDCGSVFDPYVGKKTRKYHYDLKI